MVERAGASSRQRRGPKAPEPVAAPGAAGLCKVAESRVGERGSREDPPSDSEEPAVGLGAMGVQGVGPIRIGIHAP